MECSFLCLASFTPCDAFEARLPNTAASSSSFPLSCSVLIHPVASPQATHVPGDRHWVVFSLGYYESHCCEDSHSGFSTDMYFHFFWRKIWDWDCYMLRVCLLLLTNYLLKWLCSLHLHQPWGTGFFFWERQFLFGLNWIGLYFGSSARTENWLCKKPCLRVLEWPIWQYCFSVIQRKSLGLSKPLSPICKMV